MLVGAFNKEKALVRAFIVIVKTFVSRSKHNILSTRLRVSLKRMQDRDIDNLANPHEVKHWMDPKLIPYGWGLFEGLDISEDLGS